MNHRALSFLLAAVVLSLSAAPALAENGPMQGYLHREGEQDSAQSQDPDALIDYATDKDRLKYGYEWGDPIQYNASYGSMMLNLTAGQSDWEFDY